MAAMSMRDGENTLFNVNEEMGLAFGSAPCQGSLEHSGGGEERHPGDFWEIQRSRASEGGSSKRS